MDRTGRQDHLTICLDRPRDAPADVGALVAGTQDQARLAITWRRGDDSPVLAAFLEAVRVQRARWLRAR